MDTGKSRSAGQRASLEFHVFEYGETIEIAGMVGGVALVLPIARPTNSYDNLL